MRELRIAPARTPGELGSLLSIGRIVHPGPMPSVDGLLHELATSPKTVFLLASLDDVAVGTGVGKTSSVGDAYYSMARVLPAHRGAGVGTAILSALSDHAHRAGRRSLIGRLREDDEDALRFVEHRGFNVLSRECPVSLDLSAYEDTARDLPVGVEILSLAERPDLVEAAYEVHSIALRDVPVGSEPPTASPLAEWVAETIHGPEALPDLCLVALVDAAAVGFTGLTALAGDEGEAVNLLTGVLPEARGRGIATALKHEQARRAKHVGFRRIETVNDEANAPMRAVNARIGFEAEPIWLLVHRPPVPARE